MDMAFPSPCTWLVLGRRQRAPAIGKDKMETLRGRQHEEKQDGTFSMPGEGEQVLLLLRAAAAGGALAEGHIAEPHTHAGLLAAEQQQSHHCEAFCPLAAQRGGPAGCRDKRPLNIASLAVLGKGSERMLPDVRRFLRFSAAPHQPHPTINTALNDRLAS